MGVRDEIEGKKETEIVRVDEPARVLELLFQFVYPREHRELDDLPFELLEKLAEASEKYQLFAAMGICRAHMQFVFFPLFYSYSVR